MTTETYTTDAAGRKIIPKAIDATLDYSIDLTQWLAGISDVLSSATATVTGHCTVNSVSNANGIVTAWVSGGTVYEVVQLTFHFVTVGGRTDSRSVYLQVLPR